MQDEALPKIEKFPRNYKFLFGDRLAPRPRDFFPGRGEHVARGRGLAPGFLHFSAIFRSSTHYMWGRRFRLPTCMFYRRRLPYWHPDIAEATFLFVTWRLAGSIPRTQLLQRLAGKSAYPTTLSAGRAFLALDREADKAAFGPVWLRDARIARVVADALLHGETGRHFYQLRAWVIMPNHVHVLLRPEASLPVITRWLKGSTARQANLILGRTGEAFWQDECFDHRVRDEVELDRIVRYVEHNPVSAGLAANPCDWPWSSARLAGESACPTMGASK